MKKERIYSKFFLTILVGMFSFFTISCSEEKPEECYVEAYAHDPYPETITQTTAILNGEIMTNGAIVTEYGFYLSNKRAELETAAAGAKKVISGSSYSNFTYQATGLTSNTTYYFRAFASNGTSTVYGEIKEFTTRQPSEPTLDYLIYSNITDNSVDLSCKMIDAGVENANTITLGFEYKKQNDANWISKTDGVQQNKEDGSFYVTLTGLISETDYMVRAFAKNTHGTGYSYEEYITTSKKLTPVVSMDDINSHWWYENSDVTATGVKVSGYIDEVYSDDGVVSEVGFIYGTSSNLTYASADHIVATPDHYGKGGKFTAELVNKLLPSTQYYICPYAKDEGSEGSVYGYGDIRSFTTREFESPHLERINAEANGLNSISVSVTNIKYSGALVEYGVIWREGSWDYDHGSGSDLTLENCGENKITFTPNAGETLDSFSAIIENLETNTSYYIKAYAISSYEVDGQTYQSDPGYVSTYASTQDLNIPSVKYVESKKTTYTTLTVSSGIESYDETATITECGFIWTEYSWEISEGGLTLDNCGENKLVATLDENNNFEGTITGLNLGTNYCVSAYVQVTYPNGEIRTGYYRTSQYTSSIYISINVNDIKVDSFTASATMGDYYSSIDWSELGDTFEAGFCWATNAETNPDEIPAENRVSAELTDSYNQKTCSAVISVPEESGVTYYVWAYLKYKNGIVYSSCTSVTSKNIPEKDDHGNPEIKE